MFNQAELNYLLRAVEALPPAADTNVGRQKAFMITKICNLIDEQSADQDVKDVADTSSKKPPAKKVTRKKK